MKNVNEKLKKKTFIELSKLAFINLNLGRTYSFVNFCNRFLNVCHAPFFLVVPTKLSNVFGANTN